MTWRIEEGHVLDVLRAMPEESVQCVVTSPPYFGLRAYGTEPQLWGDGWLGELGSEPLVDQFIGHLVEVFSELRRVLRADGTCWVNIGDSYCTRSVQRVHGNRDVIANMDNGMALPPWSEYAANGRTRYSSGQPGLKDKDLYLVPERLAIALQSDGWYVRSRIAWCKTSAMPEAVKDRPTGAWEPIFLLARSRRYHWDADAVRTPFAEGTAERYEAGYNASWRRAQIANPTDQREAGFRGTAEMMERHSGANLRNYWVLGPEPFTEAHFATFPTEIPRRAILAGTSEKGCCPACGASWQRVTDSRLVKSPVHGEGSQMRKRLESTDVNGWAGMPRLARETNTTGWEPSCACPPAEPIPCTVMDPFSGSGTTVMTALRLGRSGIGIELNPTYAEMARSRIVNDAPLWNTQ